MERRERKKKRTKWPHLAEGGDFHGDIRRENEERERGMWEGNSGGLSPRGAPCVQMRANARTPIHLLYVSYRRSLNTASYRHPVHFSLAMQPVRFRYSYVI